MPRFTRDTPAGPVSLQYVDLGDPSGLPVLLIAPGGMNSAMTWWRRSPWNPLDRLDRFRVIGMDQRNAGQSTAPVVPGDGWHVYTEDQLALLDHLGVDRFSVVGMCIGGPYIAALCKAAPERVDRAVMFQPIGLDDNRDAFFQLFDAWAAALAPKHPGADWAGFREAMFGGDFLFDTTEAEAAAIETPTLLFAGDDDYHPRSISDRLAALLPNVTFVEAWKHDAEAVDAAVQAFLGAD